MAKKRTKLAITYFVTILVTAVIILIAGFIMIKTVNSRESVNDIIVTTVTDSGKYEPSVLDNQTTLFIIDTDDRMSATVFILTRLLPSEKRFVIVPIQSDLYVNVGGEQTTLYDIYRRDDVQGAKRAIESACGIPVEKYLKYNGSAFEKMASHFENVNYVFPYSLICEDQKTKETTVIRSGNQQLSPSDLRKVFTFPDFKNGESERAAVIGSIFNDLINTSHTRYQTGLDVTAEGIIGSAVDTDITEYDFDFKKDALNYMIEGTSAGCAELVLPSGTYNSESEYVFDEDFIVALKKWFGLDTFDFSDEPPANNEASTESKTQGLLPEVSSASALS